MGEWSPVITAALVAVLVVTAFIAWLRLRPANKSEAATLLSDTVPVLLVMLGLLLSWAVLTFGSLPDLAFDQFMTGFSASLLEDILFFSMGGLILFMLQKADFYSGRRLEDRVDYLFNAKRLSSEERSYLKQELQSISCDFIRDETVIDLVELDAAHHLVRLDVSRRFLIGNYLKEQKALYKFESKIAHDAMPDARVAMEVFPVSMRPVARKQPAPKGAKNIAPRFEEFESIGVPDVHGAHELRRTADAPFEIKPALEILIAPGQIMMVEVRWRGWHDYTAVGAAGEPFEVEFIRHWDAVSFRLRNSLTQEVELRLDALQTKQPYTLQSGMACDKEWSGLDVTPGTKVLARFMKL